MVDGDPTDYSMWTYLWVFGLSIWGGLANFINKVKQRKARWINITELFGELFISGGVGLLTFFICEYSNTPQLISAVCIAISGHMGTRIIYLLENKVTRIIDNTLPTNKGE